MRADVDRELSMHLQTTIDDLVDAGWRREDAERQARAQFGDYTAIADECGAIRHRYVRHQHRSDRMNGFVLDLSFAWRALKRSPTFTIVAVSTLALGIGANTTVFSALRAVLLAPLPFADADRVVAISLPKNQSFSKARLLEIRRRQTSFDGIAAYSRWGASLTGD